ncbi:hypothetical protein LDO32_11700 [Luteimonas sp. Y-2-2-4F]|nr:hypothetical protein [Luteimonas sp. Y-2-2-4F]MCD9032389.1 hypothetical protein [Luteimonas sp. Y-2-2-4F]
MFDPISRLSNHLPFGGPGNSPLLSLAQSLTSSLAQSLGLGPNRFDGDHRTEHRPSHHHHGPNHSADGGSRGDGPRETHDTPGSRHPNGASQPGAPGPGSTVQATQTALDRATSTLATLLGQAGSSSSSPAAQTPSLQDALPATLARQLASGAAAGGAAALAGPAAGAQAFQAAVASGATALSTAAALAQAQGPVAAQAAAASGHAMGLTPGGAPVATTAAQAPASLAGAAMPLAAQPPLARAEAQAAIARSDVPGTAPADRAGAFAPNASGTTAASSAPAGATTAASAAASMAAAGATLATMAAPATPAVPASQSPADVRGHTGLSMGGERGLPGRPDGALAQGHTVSAASRRALYGGDGRGRSSLGGLFAMIGVGSQAARQELADLQKAELAYQWLYWVLLITAFAALGLLIVAVAPFFGAPVAHRSISQPGWIAVLLAIGAPAGIGAWLLAARRR